MGRFSNALTQAIQLRGWNASRYCEAGDFNSSRVSRWLKGTIAPEPDSLAAVLAPFDDHDKAIILRAYLTDIAETASPGSVKIIAEETATASEPIGEYFARAKPPEGLSDELWAQVCRVAELARDVPEVAAIFAEFDRLIQRRAIQP